MCDSNCGTPAETEATAERVHEYFDKEGDLIDLAVVRGVYKNRFDLTDFFRLCTNYSQQEINEAINYIERNVTPVQYSDRDARRMRKQIEQPIIELDKSKGIESFYTTPTHYGSERSNLLLVSWAIGGIYAIWLVYALATGITPQVASIWDFALNMMVIAMLPHAAFEILGLAFNIAAWYSNNHKLALTGAILYSVSIAAFPLMIAFVAAPTALSYVAFAKMRKE